MPVVIYLIKKIFSSNYLRENALSSEQGSPRGSLHYLHAILRLFILISHRDLYTLLLGTNWKGRSEFFLVNI